MIQYYSLIQGHRHRQGRRETTLIRGGGGFIVPPEYAIFKNFWGCDPPPPPAHTPSIDAPGHRNKVLDVGSSVPGRNRHGFL